MAEQMGTPGSNADLSTNGGKISAPKDKSCPFCQQHFTSSSLGRHLDLYIKEKNPKPADGLHDVAEIRKMRGGITRRQPRNSTSRREDSTPAGTPSAQERRSPRAESDAPGNGSPSLRMDENNTSETNSLGGKSLLFMNKASWEATGVMNNIPATRNGDSARSWDGDDRGRREVRNRSVSKQMLAKTTFEQKQKMMEALDNAKAAELALREVLGSLRAAKQRVDRPSIFDYDPLALDFPALTLHCLPPPPTINQSTPLPNSSSWSILPPDEQQYQALRNHLSEEFRRWRISCATAATAPQEDMSYPPQRTLYKGLEDAAAEAKRMEAAAAELEVKVSDHVYNMFTHWKSLALPKRTEIWTLELARSLGRKSEEVQKIRKEKEFSQQETEHLKLQVDQLSRLQQPREYRLSAPATIPFDKELMDEIADSGLQYKNIGLRVMDQNMNLDALIERIISRWKGVVKEARGLGGIAAQKPLSGETVTNTNTNPTVNVNAPTNGVDAMGSDQDADADADMEEDDSFVEMTDAPASTKLPSEVPTTATTAANFRLTNGVSGPNQGGNSHVIEGLENQNIVSGYVRIGA